MFHTQVILAMSLVISISLSLHDRLFNLLLGRLDLSSMQVSELLLNRCCLATACHQVNPPPIQSQRVSPCYSQWFSSHVPLASKIECEVDLSTRIG